MNSNLPKTTTAEALLGLLSMEPMSGYDLKQRIDFSIGNFWSESFGQIYPTLKKLEEDGSVTSSEEGKAGRKVYALTEAGRERLAAWLDVPARPRVPRHELLLKVFFGSGAAIETVREQVALYRSRFAGEAQRYDGTEAHLRRTYGNNAALPYWLMTLHYGRMEAQMMVAWSDETLATLETMATAAATKPKRNTHPARTVRRTADAR